VVVKLKPVWALALAGFLACGAASAQPAPPEAPSRPESKTIGDWEVRCFAVKNAHPCDVFQEMANKDTRQRILSISLAYDIEANRHLLQISVPLDIAIQKGLTIQTDSYTSPVLKYRMCNREGCFIQLAADDALVAGLAKSGPQAKLNIVGDNGKAYGLQFSLKGFSAAHDDMVAQARAKAKPAAKP
jgi:invasion protein IalB